MLVTYTTHIETPVGFLEVQATEKGITSIKFVDQKKQKEKSSDHPIMQKCIKQLQEYFDGKRVSFDSLHLHFPATDFQRSVWDNLMDVPYGEAITYGELAQRAGHKGAARAVGIAMNTNPLSIIIPCHRVLPADRSIGEYASGSHRKQWLLEHEKAHCAL